MKQQKKSLALWFVVMSAVSVLASVCVLLVSRGDALSRMFFSDVRDTGMDFFHSIEYVRGRRPYSQFNTLYPPLANLLFYIVYWFVPRAQSDNWANDFYQSVVVRGTDLDLRTWQAPMVLFVAFVMLSVAAILIMARKCAGKNAGVNADLFAMCVLFSYGVLNSFERGNIVIVAFLCCLFFVWHQHSRSRLLEALGIIFLAVSAGLKLYPALFGMMLVYSRQYRRAGLAVVAGLAAFVLPVLIFQEGLRGIGMFFEQLKLHAAETADSEIGFSFDGICRTLMKILDSFRGEADGRYPLLEALSGLNIAAAALMLACGFFLERQWQQALACCVAMLLYAYQYLYSTVFFLIPLLVMIREEKALRPGNAVAFFALVLSVLWLPIMDPADSFLSLVYGRFQLCMAVLAFYIVVSAVAGILRKLRRKDDRAAKAQAA